MKSGLHTFLVFVLGCFACSSTGLAETNDDESPIMVSVTRLLEQPHRYENKLIVVKGFLKFGVGALLYTSKDHAVIKDLASAIRLADERGLLESGCDGNYVEVVGRFVRVGSSFFGVSRLEKVRCVITDEICWSNSSPHQ